ncbi:UDP-N-acetylmuramate dehydrogenase [Corynebacterium anserum]|uniref:UDP-N-acetylenolpyruvoylglucosamine reductase n=1 Tax=Corynebacterium anserum TaxID=2684406 RepID=A0A7G7YRC4_9CORY|nr:UDP-N-acetylmuramate dehydrogenase [Corynebacterium anserum]
MSALLNLIRRPGFIPGARVVRRTFADLTTLRIGGQPAAVVACSRPTSLAAVVSLFDAAQQPLVVLGGGSNLVIGDGDDVNNLVAVWATDASQKDLIAAADVGAVGVHSADNDSTGDIAIDEQSGIVRAYAGVNFDRLVAKTVAAGLSGLECLSGIPGSVGATPVQNVGAYGAEISQVLSRVQLYDRGAAGEYQAGKAHELTSEEKKLEAVRPDPFLHWVSPDELELSYRHSNLKHSQRAVVTAVEFQLGTDGMSRPVRFGELARALGVDEADATAGNSAARRPIAEVREAVLALRTAKGMVLDPEDHDTWSAGSFFTNPIVQGTDARDAVIAAVRQTCGDAVADSMPIYSAGRSGAAEDRQADDSAERFKFSAAWLIERAGFNKGWHVEGNSAAALSSKHTLALTNRGQATSEDIIELARAVRNGVRDAFGVVLTPEPVWIGASLD